MKNNLSDFIINEHIEEAMKGLLELHIDYPAFNENLALIERCRAMTRLTKQSECCAILGDSGVGKSHLAEYFLKKYPAHDGPNGRVVPVLLVEVPKMATIKSLLAEMLTKLDYAESVGASRAALMRALWPLLRRMRVDTIIIDEGQHMSDTAKRDREVADWLKTLINESKCCVVLMGIPSTETILASSECQQTAQRFKRVRYIKAFTWKRDNPGKEFRVFLKYVEKALPLPKPSNLFDPEKALRLFCTTRGYLRPLIRVVRAATMDCLMSGAECLDIEHLDQAMRLEINERIPLHANPFFAKLDDVLVSVLGPWKSMVDTPSSNRPGKQKKPPGPKDTLHK